MEFCSIVFWSQEASCHRIKVISILDEFSVKGQLEDFEDKDLGDTEDPYGN